jgi:2,4-dienoyl-CoA reductase-like NADH-dependent reductase (Old Yellow Enzyme family)
MTDTTATNIEAAYQPFESERLNLPGRLVRAPVWSSTADAEGFVCDTTLDFYSKLAGNGLGLIITGFAFVSDNSQAVPRMLGISNDDFIPGLTTLVEAVHARGDKIALQIAHCGLNADPYFDPDGRLYSPSLIMLNGSTQAEKSGRLHKGNAHIMRSLTRWQIDQIIDEFIEAAERAQEAGFDAVEVHGAHHYLISEFLSPAFNKRTDIFGGGSRQRSRFAVDIVRGIREAMPSLPIIFRLNCEDFTPGGITLDDSLVTAEMVAEAGADIISVSGNNPVRTRIVKREKEAYFREQAKVIRQASERPVLVTGGIRSPEGVNEILSGGFADLVGVGRPLIRTPDLPARWREGNFAPYDCISCNGCMRAGMEYTVSCVRMGENGPEKEEL